MSDPYRGREQTQAKHFILRRYLQALAFKVLTFSDITYVDGFSGPWRTQTEDFADSSFMIAIQVLRDAQQQTFERTGKRRRLRCFFSESDPAAYAQLEQAVAPWRKPAELLEIQTYGGKFEDAVPQIQSFIDGSFPLIFIDPTGWTGYRGPPHGRTHSLGVPATFLQSATSRSRLHAAGLVRCRQRRSSRLSSGLPAFACPILSLDSPLAAGRERMKNGGAGERGRPAPWLGLSHRRGRAGRNGRGLRRAPQPT